LSSYAAGGSAILLGVDANLNSIDCALASHLRPLYVGDYGGPFSTVTCQYFGYASGYGPMYEADQHHAGGDGTYTAMTYPSEGWKIDYVFFNWQKWYADYNANPSGSTVSDHSILRGEGTLHW